MPRKNRNIKGSKKWCLIIGIGFLAASGILLCYAANQEFQKAAAEKLYREIQVRELENSEEEQESESTSKSADVEKEETGSSVKLPVNIPEIQKEMPDIYGWIIWIRPPTDKVIRKALFSVKGIIKRIFQTR